MELHRSAYRHAMARVLEELTERYADGFDAAEIAVLVDRKRSSLEAGGKHAEFIPALVEHAVRDELATLARSQGRTLSPLPKVLFVCERNEGRSQVAAALAEHLSGGRVLARSGGLRPTGRLNPHASTVLAERGIDLVNPLPSEVQEDVLDAADILVLIGCQDAPLVGRRTIHWEIDDPYAQDLPAARRIAAEIESRVRELLAELEVPIAPQRELAHTA
ncbi:arsenate reductase ArsC [Ornithinimicrobium faecis]|uniref:Arsenate reductase ArsC n=1 Tax=Ornithinimicrobium faecis TaxID=2934158 RepID=A0ABY4YT25_9MICO|nr:arsenate reductase ArsC [Ornithinimicrobium sp. HY1793]USQ79518.1 arsenate reductase ArsC [Ornithinimicrobium sp. HY1793]